MTTLEDLYSDEHRVRSSAMTTIADAANAALRGTKGVVGARFIWVDPTDPLDDPEPAVGAWVRLKQYLRFGPIQQRVLRAVAPMGIAVVVPKLWVGKDPK